MFINSSDFMNTSSQLDTIRRSFHTSYKLMGRDYNPSNRGFEILLQNSSTSNLAGTSLGEVLKESLTGYLSDSNKSTVISPAIVEGMRQEKVARINTQLIQGTIPSLNELATVFSGLSDFSNPECYAQLKQQVFTQLEQYGGEAGRLRSQQLALALSKRDLEANLLNLESLKKQFDQYDPEAIAINARIAKINERVLPSVTATLEEYIVKDSSAGGTIQVSQQTGNPFQQIFSFLMTCMTQMFQRRQTGSY